MYIDMTCIATCSVMFLNTFQCKYMGGKGKEKVLTINDVEYSE